MRTKGYYKTQVKRNNQTGLKPCDRKSVIEDPQLILDYMENLQNLDSSIRNWKLEDGINWFLGLETYVKDKCGNLRPKYPNRHLFNKGQIVLVDFFGHIGNELTYEHPAIVIHDTYDGVVVAPISSSCYQDGEENHVDLERNISTLGNVPNNCGIKLEQLRFISKRRIIQKFKRVSCTTKLNEIDDVLMKLLAKRSYEHILKQHDLLLDELTKKNDELIKKDEEIKNLERRLTILEDELDRNSAEGNVS